MNSNWIFILYYLYAIFVVGLFSYVVFWLGRDGWWFVVAFLLLQIQPKIESKSE